MYLFFFRYMHQKIKIQRTFDDFLFFFNKLNEPLYLVDLKNVSQY